MSLEELVLALLVLLLTPGPTNTLMALAGAERGWTLALRLIPAELAGYLLAVVPLNSAGAAVLQHVPKLSPVITTLAAAWVLLLAIRMWRIDRSTDGGAARVTAPQVFVTTLLNPKALVIGLVLLPSPDPLAPRLALFVALVIGAATVWAGAGAAVTRNGDRLPRWLSRLAAGWLAILSATLAAKAMGA